MNHEYKIMIHSIHCQVLPETPKKGKLTPMISQDLVSIEPSVDWFNYMAYDLHGTWDIGNEWTGAFLDAHTNLTEIESSMNLLWWNNITSSKVNLGLAFYGRSFTIASPDCDTPGCAYLSAGDEGVCSASAGILLSSEIEQIISDNDLTPVLYKDAAVKAITVGANFILQKQFL